MGNGKDALDPPQINRMLTQLPVDVFGIVLFFTEAEDIFSLMACGNTALTRHLVRSCRNLFLESNVEKSFPYWAFKLSKLVNFVIFGTQPFINVPLALKENPLKLKEGLHDLKVLEFDFASSLDVVRDGGASLSGLFPRLHSLVLMGSCDLVNEASLTHMPRTLQTLILLPTTKHDRSSHFHISAIARLPETLTRLELSHVTVSCSLFDLKTKPCFPPNLKKLALDSLGHPEPLKYLPPQLEELDIRLEYDGMMEMEPWTFEASKYLPPSLTHFSFSAYFRDGRLDHGPPWDYFVMDYDNLPPSILESLKEYGWYAPSQDDDVQ